MWYFEKCTSFVQGLAEQQDKLGAHMAPFYTARSAGQKGCVNMQQLGGSVGTPRNMSCDWSTRFMRVILRGLSLVSTNLQVLKYRCTVTGLQYKHTSVQLIQA